MKNPNSIDRALKHVEALFAINTESDYLRARDNLDELVDQVGSDEEHPRAVMMDTLATLVHEEHHPTPLSLWWQNGERCYHYSKSI